MTTPLSKIVGLLPELTSNELTQLTALLSVRSAAASHPRDGALGRIKSKAGNSKPKAKKENGGKSTENKVSMYRDIPEYKEFKASEKALHSYLKGQEGDEKLLSHWVKKQSEIMALSDVDRANLLTSIPPVVAGFIEARNCWFRTKGNLSTEGPALGLEPPCGSNSEGREEVAEEGASAASPTA